jgi:phosphoribosylformylglycinamidine synthase
VIAPRLLVLAGDATWSPARVQRVVAKLRARGNPDLVAASARTLAVTQVARPLTPSEHDALVELLAHGSDHEIAADARVCERIVVPRLGTISPWSSKATDICHTSHAWSRDAVLRVERGVRWRFTGAVVDRAALDRVIADRMTESVIDGDDDFAAMFATSHWATIRRLRYGRPMARWAWRWRPMRSITWSPPTRGSAAIRPTSSS